MRRSKNARISNGQIKAIKTLQGKLGMSDADYKGMIEGYGFESCTEFSNGEAGDLIRKLSELLPADMKIEPKKYYGTGERGRQRNLTQLQAERIDLLEKLLGWERKRTTAFVIRQVGAVKIISTLMNYEAVKVITGMQKVFAGNLAEGESVGRSFEDTVAGLKLKKETIRMWTKDIYEIINNSTNKQLLELYERSQNRAAGRG